MGNSLVSLLRDSVSKYPEKDAVIHRDERMRYGALWNRASTLALFLKHGGLRHGDRVSILLENSIAYVVSYYAVLMAGGAVVALNTAVKARDLKNWIVHSDSKWLIADSRHAEFKSVAAELSDTLRYITTGGRENYSGTGVYWFDDITQSNSNANLAFDVSGNDLAAIIYTSGTTGRPKGVMLSHENLYENVRSILDYLRLSSADSILNVLPFYYSYGNSVLHTHLAVGASIVIENSMLYPHKVVEVMASERVTGFSGVPSTYSLLLNRVKLGEYDLSSLRYVTQAGGAMAPANIERIRNEVPAAKFFVMYGQTEAAARLTYLPPENLDNKMGSVGIPIPGVTIELFDEHGNTVKNGEVGEICARGKNIMLGYWQDDENTNATVRDGWLHTGDLARRDDDGYLYIIGRSTEMIKSGAHRISPKEIEEVIQELNGIEEVAVIGVPDEILGQSIKAVVVQSPESDIEARTIQKHCKDNLAAYKVPKLIEFVSELPKTASGKIKRFMLQG